MEVRSRQDAKSACIKRRNGAMSAGVVLEEELCLLPEGCRFALRGHGQEGNRRTGEGSLVAVAL